MIYRQFISLPIKQPNKPLMSSMQFAQIANIALQMHETIFYGINDN